MTQAPVRLDIAHEVAAVRAELEARADPAYVAGMRRTVPSSLPAHAVHVPEMRKVVIGWLRQHKQATTADVLALAKALWSTGWREEGCVAIGLIAHSPQLVASLPWKVVERWSSQIENWEHVDHLMDATAAMLVSRPDLLADVERLAESSHSWQRRLAIVTLIQAARKQPLWAPQLEAMAQRLTGDRGQTLRKAVAWARRVLGELEMRTVRV
jgi:3-methyladenine DNA glycosylase AlkD